MLRISKAQFEVMKTSFKNSEMRWAIGLLNRNHAAWCAQRSPEEIMEICTNTLNFAQQCDIHSKPSLQCLLELYATGRWPSLFSEWQKLLLTRQGFTEETRLAQFLETLSGSDQRFLISLDTDLSTLESISII